MKVKQEKDGGDKSWLQGGKNRSGQKKRQIVREDKGECQKRGEERKVVNNLETVDQTLKGVCEVVCLCVQ